MFVLYNFKYAYNLPGDPFMAHQKELSSFIPIFCVTSMKIINYLNVFRRFLLRFLAGYQKKDEDSKKVK